MRNLTPQQFRDACSALGFQYVGGLRQAFVDLRRKGPAQPPVLDARRRIDRAASLAKLRAYRAQQAHFAERAAVAAETRRRLLDQLAPTSFVPARSTLAGCDAICQLAEDMRQAGSREGGVTRDDLLLMGWTPQQLDDIASAARSRAHQLSGAGA